mgnify:CR=1 FL=1
MCYSLRTVTSMQTLASTFDAVVDDKAFAKFAQTRKHLEALSPEQIKMQLGLKRLPAKPIWRWAPDEEDQRVYPGYFLPAIISEAGERKIAPMRYRVRPEGSAEEIPSKFNVFNCRDDAITRRQTWRKLFSRRHALVPFTHFYEWVAAGNQKQQVAFYPKGFELSWAPALFDEWQSTDSEISFRSLAIITREPPPEILAAGHDRCPILLEQSKIDVWLNPESHTQGYLLDCLQEIERPVYGCERV